MAGEIHNVNELKESWDQQHRGSPKMGCLHKARSRKFWEVR